MNKVFSQYNVKNLNNQRGFTLIELVIVVVILGFLAVTAIPKFLDLTDKAKQANIEGMAGGFATGVSLVRAQWEAEGRPTAANVNRIDYEGSFFALTTPPTPNNTKSIRPGYPVGLVNGNASTADMTNARCIELWQGVFAQPPSVSSAVADLNTAGLNIDYLADTTSVELIDSAGATQTFTGCVFYLKESLDKNAAGNFVTPAGNTGIGNNFTYNAANSEVVVNINTP